MEKMVYEWGSKSYKVDAQVVGETVERIAKRKGYCAPSQLVAAAWREDSPLHPLFTWDDATAAANWRHHEARQVIRSLSITVKINDQDEKMPAFISVGHTEKNLNAGEGYRPLSVIVKTPEFHDEALAEVLSRLEALRKRYAALNELAPVWEALDRIRAA